MCWCGETLEFAFDPREEGVSVGRTGGGAVRVAFSDPGLLSEFLSMEGGPSDPCPDHPVLPGGNRAGLG